MQMITALTVEIRTLQSNLQKLRNSQHYSSDTKNEEKPSKVYPPTTARNYRKNNPPKEGDPQTFTKSDGEVIKWCKQHGWNNIHFTSECNKLKAKNDPTTTNIRPIAGLSSLVKDDMEWRFGRLSSPQLIRRPSRGHLTSCFYSLTDLSHFDELYNPGQIGLFHIVVDSGASHCYTFDKRDFITDYETTDPISVKGIAEGLSAIGKVIVRWHVTNDAGVTVMIELEAYLLPKLPVRLMSPQQLAKAFPSPTSPALQVYSAYSVLSWANNTVTLRHDRLSNLPILYAATINVTIDHTAVLCAFNDTATAQRLSNDQVDLLQIHRNLGHMPMELIQTTLCGYVYPARLRKCRIPLCAACQYGKQTKRPLYKRSFHPIRIDQPQPGDEVSTDQFESSVRGRQTYGNGKSQTN